MILVTRLNGSPFAVNPDLLERVEATPDTVLTLIDGTKYIVGESLTEVVHLVREYRASVVASAQEHHAAEEAAPCGHSDGPRLHLAPVAPAAVTPLPSLEV